jgi:O-antigen ligase
VPALIAAWSLFAFGGAYGWTTVPIIAGAFALAVAVRPPVLLRGWRALDAAILASLLIAAAQTVPLPSSLCATLSPSLPALDRALYFDGGAAALPLTVDRRATLESLVLAVAVVVLFWSSRAIFAAGAVRRTIRVLAACGLVASAIAIVQHTTAPALLYWLWRPISPGAFPYSPFVNRNDLAAWLVMAIPLTVGYLAARVDARPSKGRPSWLQASMDDHGAWLLGAVCAMTAALIVALSRSGLAAFTGGLITFAWITRSRVSPRGRWRFAAGLIPLAFLAAVYGNPSAMMTRAVETMDAGIGSRREIWHHTARIVADFPLTGVGLGAFARAMSVYQPPHLFAFNHAHSEYLQVAAEGGIAMGCSVLIALLAGVRIAVRRLGGDRTPSFWIRAGAISACAAVAIQSIWETGLRMPANAVLFALCCAIAVCAPANRDERSFE